MRKYFNKLYLSIALVVLSLLTMVATTYAWVGLLTGTTFDEFEINLLPNDIDDENNDYGLEFSLTGELGTFKENIDQIELKRTLLTNTGMDVSRYNDNYAEKMFSRYRMEQCTTKKSSQYTLGQFTNMRGEATTNYFWFDLYISIFRIGNVDDQADKNLSLYLRNKILDASITETGATGIYTTKMFNPVEYPSVNPVGKTILGREGGIPLGATISGDVSIDIANSCRVALEKYEIADKGDKSIYQYNRHTGLFIFQKGSLYPMYNSITNVYDFGGIQPDDYNFARVYYNTTHPEEQLPSVPQEILDRGDVQYADDGTTNRIISTEDGVTTSKMARFRIYFWFEGWDSNCFDVVDNKTVSVNLSFSTKNPNEEIPDDNNGN